MEHIFAVSNKSWENKFMICNYCMLFNIHNTPPTHTHTPFLFVLPFLAENANTTHAHQQNKKTNLKPTFNVCSLPAGPVLTCFCVCRSVKQKGCVGLTQAVNSWQCWCGVWAGCLSLHSSWCLCISGTPSTPSASVCLCLLPSPRKGGVSEHVCWLLS